MNTILAALNRAVGRRTDINQPALTDLTPYIIPTPEPELIQPVTAPDPLDIVMRALGPYVADPRLLTIGITSIRINDGRTLHRIAEPGTPYPWDDQPRAAVWRLYTGTVSSMFWWRDLQLAFADILGRPQLPDFLAETAHAALNPDSNYLPEHTHA